MQVRAERSMPSRNLGSTLIVLGVVGVLGAIAWWQEFYGQVAHFLGTKAPPPIECLYQNAGPCSLVASVAAWGGVMPYDPKLIWGAGGLIVLGTVLWFVQAVQQAIEPPGNYPTSSKSQPGRTRDFQ